MLKRLPAERVPPPDEWGIYDPAKAGMQALFARLGRPVLRGSTKKIRQERRRAFRPERERSADGVGLAIKEAMDRVGAMDRAALEAKAAEAKPAETKTAVMEPVVPASPARAVRIALKAAKTPLPMVEEAAPEPPAAVKRKAARRTKAETAVVLAEPAAPQPLQPQALAAAPLAEAEVALKTRPRKTAKARVKAEPAPAVVALTAPAATAPVPPAPSPRRPRGPVPLAAWAHAVTDAPKHEPRRHEKRGFWKAIFRIPSDVALVEYAHGCRIHRLLIETSDDLPMLDLI